MSFLVLDSSLNFTLQTVAAGKQGTADLQVTVTDTRPFLFVKHVGIAIDWGDGTPLETVEKQESPYTDSFRHFYRTGSFTIKVKVRNYQLPLAETAVKSYDVKVPGAQASRPVVDDGLQPIIYGPILPREQFPNPTEWRWHLSQDSILLESSARLLLITATGERLMNPDYGTRIRQFLFTQSDPALKDSLIQEVRRAFAAYEPRVDVASVDVQGISSREVSIAVQLVSLLDQRPFQIATTVIKT